MYSLLSVRRYFKYRDFFFFFYVIQNGGIFHCTFSESHPEDNQVRIIEGSDILQCVSEKFYEKSKVRKVIVEYLAD